MKVKSSSRCRHNNSSSNNDNCHKERLHFSSRVANDASRVEELVPELEPEPEAEQEEQQQGSLELVQAHQLCGDKCLGVRQSLPKRM
ncbi:uncharacterized protein DMAD_06409 [Drosophila madeirensis]|uniref:Uncharacterized protein n=1 Tax=Drosophila madeirensis TaxID=30013 RepID=A0AAU9FQR4_DROMD